MRQVPDTDAVRHHLIPEWYMRRFSFDSKRIRVYDRVLKVSRTDVPHNVAVERDFNTVILRDGTKRRFPEARLAELDGAVPPCLDKLERAEPLSREERWYVAFFAAYARTRGTGFRRELRARPDYGLPPEAGFVDRQFAEATPL